MLYIIVIIVTVYITHKIDKAIFFLRFENNIKFIKKVVPHILEDEDISYLVQRKKRIKKTKQQPIIEDDEFEDGEFDD